MVNGNANGNGIGLNTLAPADPINASQMAAIQRPGPTPTSLVSNNNTKRPKPTTTSTTTTAPGKSSTNLVVCQTCKHQFSRPYHLARHFRTTGHSNTIELNDEVVKSEPSQFDVFIAAPEQATDNKDWNSKPANGPAAYEQRQDQHQQQHWQSQPQPYAQQHHQQPQNMKSESHAPTNDPPNQSLTLPLPLHPHPANMKTEEMKSPRSPQPTEPDYIGDEAREGVWGYLLFPGSFTGITLKNRHMSEGSVRISSDSGYIIGRSPRCDVIIDGPTIADIQCFLFVQFDAGNFAIASVEALADGGTVVQGAAVGRGQRRQLEDGDEMVLDEAKFVFRYPDRYRRRGADVAGGGSGNGKSPDGWS